MANGPGAGTTRKRRNLYGIITTMRWRLYPASEFGRYAAEWDTLAHRAGVPAFLGARFVTPLLTEFATGSERLAMATDAEGLCAITLVQPRGHGVWQTFQPSQLPLGPWVTRADSDLRVAARSLLRSLPGIALQIGITQLDPAGIARPSEGGVFATLDYVRTAWLEVAADFEAYWEARGKNLRSNMRKQRRRLLADGIVPRLEMLSRKEEMSSALESYGRLESAGWKRAQGTAIAVDNAQGRFYRAMLENFCEAGAGRVYRYRFGDRIVAVDLCIEQFGTLVVLKTTYDEQLRQFSPASLMREDAMRAIFDEGRIHRIEFFGKLMEWHTHWTSSQRMLYHVNCYRWPWLRSAQDWRRRRGARAQEAAAQTESDPGDSSDKSTPA